MSAAPVNLEQAIAARIKTIQTSLGGEEKECTFYFIARSGEAGKAWITEFFRYRSCWRVAEHALKMCHAKQYDKGRELLREYSSALESLKNVPESLHADMSRRYHAISGYYFYCVEEFTRAHESMQRAHEQMARAVSNDECLLILSTGGLEFCLHRARIARNQRCWTEMNGHIDRARRMVSNRLPLCVRTNGQPVFYSTLAAFFRTLEPLTPEEFQAARGIIDDGARERLLDRAIRFLIRPSGFAFDWN